MPIYEFYCSACSHIEEILQKVNEPPPSVCSVCGKEGTLAKQVSQTSFQLKGGGWYSDLYASTKKTGEGKSEAASKSDSTPKTEKAEPKSEKPTSSESSTNTSKT